MSCASRVAEVEVLAMQSASSAANWRVLGDSSFVRTCVKIKGFESSIHSVTSLQKYFLNMTYFAVYSFISTEKVV